jgi:hypothetical protein
MAKINDNYTADTAPGVVDNTPGVGAQEQNNSYSVRTNQSGLLGFKPSNIASSIPSLSQIPAYKTATDTLAQLRGAFVTTVKLSLAEIGFWRQVAVYGARAVTNDRKPNPDKVRLGELTDKSNDYFIDTDNQQYQLRREDLKSEFSFQCGDYFLPLSFTYAINGGKNLALSQLVDGPEIIQQTFKKPKEVNLSIRIERNEVRLKKSPTASNMAFIDANDIGTDTEEGWIQYKIMELGAVFTDLYETQDIFRIQHNTLNKDFKMSWVIMTDFSFKPNPGATVVDIEMKLREVNMEENAIDFNANTVDSTSSAGGGSRNEG